MTDKIVGRAKGGIRRAEVLSPEKRKEIGKRAANARWGGPIMQATHGSPDHPLQIGEIQIPCYVLADGTRVLSQRGLRTGIGLSHSGGSKTGEPRLVGLFETLAEKGLDTKDLAARIRNPIRFFPPGGGRDAYGFEATILADICDVILAARKEPGLLQPQQMHMAERCEILVRGFARVGIIALIDEATGYQQDRARDALARILEAFIDKELQPWIQTFPGDFYKEMFRLRGLQYPVDTVKKPQYFGCLTNDIVYKRLAPGVLEELKRLTPKTISGNRKHRYFQRLTTNIGYPKLKEHLGAVVAFMQTSSDWNDFMTKLDRFRPRHGESLSLPFDDPATETDDGTGL